MVAVVILWACPHRGTRLDAAAGAFGRVCFSLSTWDVFFELRRKWGRKEAWGRLSEVESGETYDRAGGWEAPGLMGPVSPRRHLTPPGAGWGSGDQCLRLRAREPGSDEPRV